MKNNLLFITILFLFVSFFNLKSNSQSPCTYNNGISLVASQTSNPSYWDSMAIYFITGATDGFDSKYDSPVQFPPATWDPNTPEIWTRIPNSTKQIGGDGLPLLTTDKYVKLYLGYNNTTKNINTTLTAPKKCIKGFASKTAIWLLDSLNPANYKNLVTDSAYAFTFSNPSDVKRLAVCFDVNGIGIPVSDFTLSTGANPVPANYNVTLTFTGTAPASASFIWKKGNAHWVSGDTNTAGPIVVYWDTNHEGNQTLTLTVKGQCFTSQLKSVQVNVIPPILSVITPIGYTPHNDSISVCQNTTVTLNANSGNDYTYQWQYNGLNIPNATNSSYVANASGQYNLVVTAYIYSATSSPLYISVKQKPSVIVTPLNTIQCAGTNVTFNAAAIGDGPISYHWYKNSLSISTATNSQFSILNCQLSNAGTYTCVASNTCGPSTSNPTSLTVTALPAILDTIQNLAQCAGTSVSFKVTATGTNLSYQWLNNSTNIAGATNSTYNIPNLNSGNAGIHTCTVRNNCGSKNMKNFLLTVYTKPALNILSVVIHKNIGDVFSVSLSSPSGTPPFSYKWVHDNNIIPSETKNSFTINSVVCDNAGVYSAIISNTCGSITTQAASLFVNSCGDTLSGKVTYDNAANTVMTNILYVDLENSQNQKLDSAATNPDGTFAFYNVPNGTYKLVGGKTTLKWGGVNPIDALNINRYFVHLLTTFGGNNTLRKKAADVNNDGKINPLDALMINRRFVALIKKFNVSDWLYETPSVTVSDSSIYQALKAICAGDVNGSR
jgi:hypothetical protein